MRSDPRLPRGFFSGARLQRPESALRAASRSLTSCLLCSGYWRQRSALAHAPVRLVHYAEEQKRKPLSRRLPPQQVSTFSSHLLLRRHCLLTVRSGVPLAGHPCNACVAPSRCQSGSGARRRTASGFLTEGFIALRNFLCRCCASQPRSAHAATSASAAGGSA